MKKNNRRLIAGASLLAVLAAAPAALDIAGQRYVAAQLAGLGLSAETVVVTPAGVEMTGVEMQGLAGAQWRIGRLTGPSPLAGLFPAFAQGSGYTMENLTFASGAAKVDIPRIVVTGANVAQAELGKLLAFDSGTRERIRGFNAKSISAPEIRISASFPEAERITYTLRDVAADDIANGRIARLANGGITFVTEGKAAKQNGTIRKAEVRGLDLGQAAHVYFGVAGPDEKPATIYESYLAEGMNSHVRSTSEITMDIAALSANGLRARALRGKSLEATVAELLVQAKERAADPKRKADAKESLRIFGTMRDMFSAFEDDGMAAQGIKLLVGDKASPFANVDIARIEGTYGNTSRNAGMRLSGLTFKGPDVSGKLDEYLLEGFSYMPTFETIAQEIEAGNSDIGSIDPRRLMPRLGTLTLRGFEVDAPEPKAPRGVKPERIRVKLGALTTAASDQINGIPTKLTLAIDNLAVRLPQNSSDAGIQTLKSLGYSAVDMSTKLTAAWNEARRELVITELSLGGADMGRARVTAVIGNIGREVFEGDRTMAQVALMGATAKTVNIEINNTGLAERALAFQARQQNSKPDDIRRELGTAAALGIPAMLGPSDEAKALANAVSRFITRPKTLKIEVKAKNAAGIGIPDMVTIGSPENALKLLNLNAAASD